MKFEPKKSTNYQFLIIIAALSLAISGIYHPVFHYPFTNWDDNRFVVGNPIFDLPVGTALVKIFSPGGVTGELLYIPVTYCSYLIEKLFFGLDSTVVHTTNVVLHMLNAALVFTFIRTHVRCATASLFGALIFSVHPLMIEPVAWAMGRKDLLSTAFGLAAILLYDRSERRKWRAGYFVSVGMFTLGILSKPSLAIIPLVIFAISIIRSDQETRLTNAIRDTTPYWIIAFLVIGLHARLPSDPSLDHLPLLSRFLCIPGVVLHWLSSFSLISTLSPYYCWPTTFDVRDFAIQCLILVTAATIGGIVLYRFGDCYLRLGVIIAMIALIPSFGLVVFPRDFITADRYGYFAMTGIGFTAAALWHRSNRIPLTLLARCGLILFVVPCVSRSRSQLTIWGDNVSLWRAAAVECGQNAVVVNNLGLSLVKVGEFSSALKVFEGGLERFGGSDTILKNLAKVHCEVQDFDRAIQVLQRAQQRDPNDFEFLVLLGDAERLRGDLLSAENWYSRALKKRPESVGALFGLATVFQLRSQFDRAETAFLQVLAVEADHAEALYSIGVIHEGRGQFEQAKNYYMQAIRSDDQFVDAHYNLGNVNRLVGDPRGAELSYKRVLDLAPHRYEAAVNLGILYYEYGESAESRRYFLLAIESDSTRPEAHYHLGLLHARCDRLRKALESFTAVSPESAEFGAAAYELSKVSLRLGDKAQAIHYLGVADEHHFLGVDPEYRVLLGKP